MLRKVEAEISILQLPPQIQAVQTHQERHKPFRIITEVVIKDVLIHQAQVLKIAKHLFKHQVGRGIILHSQAEIQISEAVQTLIFRSNINFANLSSA